MDPIVPWHMSWFWVLKWGGMSGQNEWLMRSVDIDNMFKQTSGLKKLIIISIWGIKLPNFFCNPPDSYLSSNLVLNLLIKWLIMGASTLIEDPHPW
jgi:hypothetical protein